jgi:acetyltransferase-like isoleucine patch superfamily enzyme
MKKFYRGQKKGTLYIVGSGGHGLSLASLGRQSGFRNVEFLDMLSNHPLAHGLPSSYFQDVLPGLDNCSIAIAIGDNYVRYTVKEQVSNLAKLLSINLNFPNLVHPLVSIARDVTLGIGNQFFPQSNVGAGTTIVDFVILNHLSSVDHESHVSSFASLAPAAITGGKVAIGTRTALLLSSAVSHHISVGSDSVLAANSFLKENMGDLKIYGGSPAHLIRDRNLGESYL